MSADDLVGLTVAILLIVYLVAALLDPDRFS
jgi:K+-transporting ATPase KdpF subunit